MLQGLILSQHYTFNSPVLHKGGMFGNLVNKNARTALKEYGDHNGAVVDFDISPVESSHNLQFTAMARVGDRHFPPATASSKKDAKEFAADLALQHLAQEPHDRLQQGPFGHGAEEGFQTGQGFPRRTRHRRHPKAKEKSKRLETISSPPDKDPVMLLNEYGQKRDELVKFEDVQCMYPGLYKAQVTVGGQTFGPKKSSTKKMARKLVAIVALKTLMNWEPAEGLYDLTEESQHWSVGNVCTPPTAQPVQGHEAQTKSVVLHKDPIMLLNEHCQRNQLKIAYEDLPHSGPDHKKTFSCKVMVGEKSFDEGVGASKALAKKNAALNALKGLFDMPVELALKPVAGSKGGMAVERHPVSVLNEYGQRKDVKVEFEDLGHSGPDHSRTYTFRAVVGDMYCDQGSGRSKKDAKKEAAAIALKSLGYQVSAEAIKSPQPTAEQPKFHKSEVPQTPLTDGKNSVSALYELCQAYHLPQPEVVEIRPEENFDPSLYYCTFKVGDESYNCGAGRSKKAAKEMAAQHAMASLLKLKGVQQYNPGASSDGDKFAALSWNCLSALSCDAPEGWRFAGYKVIAAFIMQDGEDDTGKVVSLGTGNKCISGEHLQLDGSTVNDSHAEVIARRSLIRFLHYHLAILLCGKTDVKSIFVQKERQGKIQLRDGVKFHLYVSTAPCGDAAIFVNESLNSTDDASQSKAVFGSRQQGLLRTKVEKGEGTIPLDPQDGILTIDGIRSGQRLRTASCSDKIAKWNVLGVQGALLSILVEPVYVSSIILGKLFHPGHLSRAVSMRVELDNDNSFSNQLPSSYHVNHPKLEPGYLVQQEGPREIETKCKTKMLSLNWAAGEDTSVEVYDGCLGIAASKMAKPSRISRQALFASLKEVVKNSQDLGHRQILEAQSYGKAKELATDYQKTKSMLYKRLQETGYGSWELMQKPPEMSQFS